MTDQDYDFDFGFSMVEDEELSSVKENVQYQTTLAEVAETQVQEYKAKLEMMYNMIVPLLDNLASNPEKDYIHWPGEKRIKRINEFKENLEKVKSN